MEGVGQAVQQAASADFAHYRPQPVIEAVNALLPLGKEGALDTIESFLNSQDLELEPREGLLLVLQVLFEVPADPGYHPPLRLGGTWPPPPPAPESLPLFPLVLIDDVPLLMVAGFALGGDTEPVAVRVRHFRARGALRAKPLVPSTSTAAVLRQFQNIYERTYGKSPSPDEFALVEEQLRDLHRGASS